MSFKNWLENYSGPSAAVSSIATDAAINPPHGLWGPNELREHMRNSGAGNEAMRDLEHAIDTWRRERQSVAQTANSL